MRISYDTRTKPNANIRMISFHLLGLICKNVGRFSMLEIKLIKLFQTDPKISAFLSGNGGKPTIEDIRRFAEEAKKADLNPFRKKD